MKFAFLAVSLLLLAACGSPMSVETRDPNWKSPTADRDAAYAERLRQHRREGNAGPGAM